MSEETSRLIDQEIRVLVEEGEATARQVLTDNLDQLHKLAEALLEYETLSGDESKRAIAGEPIERDKDRGKGPAAIVGGSSIPKSKRPKGGIGGPAAAGA